MKSKKTSLCQSPSQDSTIPLNFAMKPQFKQESGTRTGRNKFSSLEIESGAGLQRAEFAGGRSGGVHRLNEESSKKLSESRG